MIDREFIRAVGDMLDGALYPYLDYLQNGGERPQVNGSTDNETTLLRASEIDYCPKFTLPIAV